MALILLFLLTGCVREEQEVLTVFAASSLTESFREIGRAFEAEHPGVKVQFNFAGSQVLVRQLVAGARGDVLVSADERYMMEALGQGLVEQPRLMVTNRLVVVVAKGQEEIENLGGLVRVKNLVLADPRVPAGVYTDQVLDSLVRIYGPELKSRIMANVVSWENNVKQVLAKVVLGDAGGALVYATDITPVVEKKVKVLEIPPEHNVEAKYYIAPVENSPQKKLADEFIDFVMSSEGQATLIRFGFLRPR